MFISPYHSYWRWCWCPLKIMLLPAFVITQILICFLRWPPLMVATSLTGPCWLLGSPSFIGSLPEFLLLPKAWMSFHRTWRSLKGHFPGWVCCVWSAHCNAHQAWSGLQPACLLLWVWHLTDIWVLPFILFIWGPEAQTSEIQTTTILCLLYLTPILVFHHIYWFTVTSAYHYQILINNWEKSEFQTQENGH